MSGYKLSEKLVLIIEPVTRAVHGISLGSTKEQMNREDVGGGGVHNFTTRVVLKSIIKTGTESP